MQAVIICGGKGIRLRSVIGNNPKALVKLGGKENLINIINNLKKNGITNLLFLVNNYEEEIKNFLKLNYSKKFIINKDKNYFGTGGSIYDARDKLKNKFLIIYSDLYFNFNFKNFLKKSINSKSIFSCVVHANDHPKDSDTVSLDKNFCVKKIYKKKSKKLKINNAVSGIYFAKKSFLKHFKFKRKNSYDLVNDILPVILKKRQKIYAYKTIEYIKDFGTMERIKIIKNDINFKKKNYKNFKILPNVRESIKRLNKNKIPCFIVSNQSGLVKGDLNLSDLLKIISKLDSYLSKNKSYIDDFLFCPHFNGSKYKNTNFSFFSNFRKPNPGMILTLANKYRIDLKKSYFVGDTDIDVLSGKRAGLKTILVEGPKIKDYKINVKPNFIVKNLSSAVDLVLRKKL